MTNKSKIQQEGKKTDKVEKEPLRLVAHPENKSSYLTGKDVDINYSERFICNRDCLTVDGSESPVEAARFRTFFSARMSGRRNVELLGRSGRP